MQGISNVNGQLVSYLELWTSEIVWGCDSVQLTRIEKGRNNLPGAGMYSLQEIAQFCQ